jgi:hypothetical protein
MIAGLTFHNRTGYTAKLSDEQLKRELVSRPTTYLLVNSKSCRSAVLIHRVLRWRKDRPGSRAVWRLPDM